LLAVASTEWVVAYAPVVKSRGTQAMASAKTVEKRPVFTFKIEASNAITLG